MSSGVDRENRGYRGVLADAASRLARSLSPRSCAHLPFIVFVPDRTPQPSRHSSALGFDFVAQRPRHSLAHQKALHQPLGHTRGLTSARWATSRSIRELEMVIESYEGNLDAPLRAVTRTSSVNGAGGS